MQRYVDVLRTATGAAVPGAEIRVYLGDSMQLAQLYAGGGGGGAPGRAGGNGTGGLIWIRRAS